MTRSYTTGMTLVERLAFYSSPPDHNGCRLWTGSFNGRGYGQLSCNGRPEKAHRLSLELKLGRPLRPGMYALHNCPGGDNRACIEPDHLWEGTQHDNIQDAIRKGTNSYPPQLKGVDHGMAQLTEKQVYAIRASRKTQTELALKYGVTQPHISLILRRQAWDHLPTQPNDRPLKTKLTPEEIEELNDEIQKLADRFGVSRSFIEHMRRK